MSSVNFRETVTRTAGVLTAYIDRMRALTDASERLIADVRGLPTESRTSLLVRLAAIHAELRTSPGKRGHRPITRSMTHLRKA